MHYQPPRRGPFSLYNRKRSLSEYFLKGGLLDLFDQALALISADLIDADQVFVAVQHGCDSDTDPVACIVFSRQAVDHFVEKAKLAGRERIQCYLVERGNTQLFGYRLCDGEWRLDEHAHQILDEHRLAFMAAYHPMAWIPAWLAK
ncbi:hypothetical protein [Pseudomonas sp.]|uniref:hypothetical protein n=1 Tax=Pseudomonas sp. TaxID=306 RepID=UPI002C010AA9|nr:hypothetical protein [Pseudomonas sp.]HUE91861.1 hypothetical protein [Pseudomonas sp.]